ncbi:MAG: hypothetical protein CR997_11045 [Acidobacteria bacterium]|nr:MAG: hypothetical protein CR997_11045 [Acidobacteriota bacterium]
MPPLNTDLMAMTAKILFTAKTIRLPIKWKKPNYQFPQAFNPSQLMVPLNPPTPPFEFFSPTANKYHVSAAASIGKKFAAYIDGICSAIGKGVDFFRSTAYLQGMQIYASLAIGTPGCLNAPPIGPTILAAAPKATKYEEAYSKAIANAIGTRWFEWQSGLIVPGLPWYPPFVSFPGPITPPTPNTPQPLIICPSTKFASLSKPALKSTMIRQLNHKHAPHHKDLFDAICKAFILVFMIWLTQQNITNAMGFGPVPTFAPPVLPAGPVVGGTVLPNPGIFVS